MGTITRDELERLYQEKGGTGAATALGISRETLYKALRRHGIALRGINRLEVVD